MNKVFIATSLDGFIADKNGNIDWLHSVPNPHNDDMGYSAFMSGIDAIVMGRVTYETVLGFDMDWPYSVPVFVLSRTLKNVPKQLHEKVFPVQGELTSVVKKINDLGYSQLYIDGGRTIQSFLEQDLIDEMIITTIPVLLGGGTQLFSALNDPLSFECTQTQLYLEKVVQSRYVRRRV